jgi:hypothetical protein
MTIDKPSMRHPHGWQAPAQLLQVLQFAPPDALVSALEAWNWPVDQADDPCGRLKRSTQSDSNRKGIT